MPTFSHFNEVAKAIPLPIHKGEHLGVCLTCKFWEVEETRSATQTPKLSICAEPHLKDFALVVSGSSGCDKWQGGVPTGPDAEAYAKKGEAND